MGRHDNMVNNCQYLLCHTLGICWRFVNTLAWLIQEKRMLIHKSSDLPCAYCFSLLSITVMHTWSHHTLVSLESPADMGKVTIWPLALAHRRIPFTKLRVRGARMYSQGTVTGKCSNHGFVGTVSLVPGNAWAVSQKKNLSRTK